jgi:hypothetical protein
VGPLVAALPSLTLFYDEDGVRMFSAQAVEQLERCRVRSSPSRAYPGGRRRPGAGWWCPTCRTACPWPAATGPVRPTCGVGGALAHRVLEVAAEDGYAAMQFNAVVETNEHAIRLWESLGSTTAVHTFAGG